MNGMGGQDTIAAIATPPGEGGIAVVRISGPDSLRIADAVFAGAPPPPSQRSAGTFVHGRVLCGGEEADEVLALIMRAPHSYTGEDTVELQGHGGTAAARRVLEAVRHAGARLAEPGEFTRRAFLNGRMDLTQAEAVLDLIRARSDRAARTALAQLEGGLGRRVDAIYDQLLQVAADLEATLDFPEDELPDAVLRDVRERLGLVRGALTSLQRTAREGRLLHEGARVVIAGRPNAGKSTLMNALLGSNRSIISHHPGTTRDAIEEEILIEGIAVSLTDTAGLRDTTCEVEQEGIRRARSAMLAADAYLYVVDGSEPCHPDDIRYLASLPCEHCLIIRNKVDLGDRWSPPDQKWRTIATSLLKGVGLEAIRTEISVMIGARTDAHESSHIVVSQRHASSISDAVLRIDHSISGLSAGDRTLDLCASQLREALESIGRITGRSYEDDLLDSIFSRFCIGK